MATSSQGKPGIAPCGHPGTHVTLNYVACDWGCDSGERVAIGLPGDDEAVPEYIEPEKTQCLHLDTYITAFGVYCSSCSAKV